MDSTIDENKVAHIMGPVQRRWRERQKVAFQSRGKQPIHLMVGGAHRFRFNTAARLGEIARQSVADYARDYVTFAQVMGLPGAETLTQAGSRAGGGANISGDEQSANWLAHTVYERVLNKLSEEPVESYCIDFEDGFGVRSDDEEDEIAGQAALELAAGMAQDCLPAEIGIRIKAFAPESMERAVRTLDGFVSAMLTATGGQLPNKFAVVLPKVRFAEEVEALNELLTVLEQAHGLLLGVISAELMVEDPAALLDREGHIALLGLVAAGQGRCHAVHFGPYDFTAALGIAARYQTPDHAANSTARSLMQLGLAGSGVRLVDGPCVSLPIPPHRGTVLSQEQSRENQHAMHRAWRACFNDVTRSLSQGFYQGWDLHPNQLPARFAAVYAFFRQELAANTIRMRNYLEQAGTATRVGEQFDDAATVRGLLNSFRSAFLCGAISSEEVAAAGLSSEQIASGESIAARDPFVPDAF